MFSVNIVLYILDNYLNSKAINLKFWNTLLYQKNSKKSIFKVCMKQKWVNDVCFADGLQETH